MIIRSNCMIQNAKEGAKNRSTSEFGGRVEINILNKTRGTGAEKGPFEKSLEFAGRRGRRRVHGEKVPDLGWRQDRHATQAKSGQFKRIDHSSGKR